MADKILLFRPQRTASAGTVESRQTDCACVIVPWPDRQLAKQAAGHPPWRPVTSGRCDMDPILVAVLRDRVARGEYRVDARTVARKLIAAHGL